MQRTLAQRTATLVAIGLLAGCSGGGGSSVPSAPAKAQTQVVKLSIQIPVSSSTSSSARHTKFTSPDTNGIIVSVTPHGQTSPVTTTGADISPTSSLCAGPTKATSGLRGCVIPINAPVGTDDFSFATYSTPENSSATSGYISPAPAGSATAELGAASLSNQTISTGVQNTLPSIVIDGIPASITFSPYHVFDGSQSQTEQVGFSVFDTSNDLIIAGQGDPFATGITVNVTDADGGATGDPATTLSLISYGRGTPSTGASSVTINHSSDILELNYAPGSSTVACEASAVPSGVCDDAAITTSLNSAVTTIAEPIYLSSTSPANEPDTFANDSTTNYPQLTLTGGFSATVTPATESNDGGTSAAGFTATKSAGCSSDLTVTGASSMSSTQFGISSHDRINATSGTSTAFTVSAGGTTNPSSAGCYIVFTDASSNIGARLEVVTTAPAASGTLAIPANTLLVGVPDSTTTAADAYNYTPGGATAPTVSSISFPGSGAVDVAYDGSAVDGNSLSVYTDTYQGVVNRYDFNNSTGALGSPTQVFSTGGSAELYGLAVAKSGLVYVAESTGTATGIIHQLTYNGGGAYGDKTVSYTLGANQQYDGPFGLAVDSAGNVYVGDRFTTKIYKYAASQFTTAGGSPAPTASFDVTTLSTYSSGTVSGIAVDGSGDLFVGLEGSNKVFEISTTFGGPQLVHTYTIAGTTASPCASVIGVAVGSKGDVFATCSNAADSSNPSSFKSSITQTYGSQTQTIDAQFSRSYFISVYP